jgi:hypothetical protein
VKLARVEMELARERRKSEALQKEAEAKIAEANQQRDALRGIALSYFGTDRSEDLKKIADEKNLQMMKEMHDKATKLIGPIQEQLKATSSEIDRKMLESIAANVQAFIQAKPEILHDNNKIQQITHLLQLLDIQQKYADDKLAKERQTLALAEQDRASLEEQLVGAQSKISVLDKELKVAKQTMDYLRQSGDLNVLHHQDRAGALGNTLVQTMASSNVETTSADTGSASAEAEPGKPLNPLESIFNLCSQKGQKRSAASATAPVPRNVRQRPNPVPIPTPGTIHTTASSAPAVQPNGRKTIPGMYYDGDIDIRGFKRIPGAGNLARQLNNGMMPLTQPGECHVFGHPLFASDGNGNMQ